MIARRVGLLLLLLSFGGTVETAYSLRQHVGFGPLGIRLFNGSFSGPSYTYSEHSEAALADGGAVLVENAFGAVRIKQGAPGHCTVNLTKVVYMHDEREAKAFADGVHATTRPSPEGLHVGTNRAEHESGGIGDTGFETHLELEVPAGTPVVVRNEHGEVEATDVKSADVATSFDDVRLTRVAGDAKVDSTHGNVWGETLGGKVTVSARFGGVELKTLGGDAQVEVEHGDVHLADAQGARVRTQFGSVTVDRLQGALDAQAEHGGIEATDIKGAASAAATFDGVTLTNVGGEALATTDHGSVAVRACARGAQVQASFDDVSLSDITGAVAVKVEHGGVRATQLKGGGRIQASGDGVSVAGFSGPLEVQARNADVTLDAQSPLTAAVTVNTTHGNVELTVPAGSRFQLDMQSEGGDVVSELPGLTTTQADKGHLVASLGGGTAPVKLRSEQGDVKIAGPAKQE